MSRPSAAGIEVAQEVPAETQGAILPLVPHLDTLRWVFIAVALAGVAVAIYAHLRACRHARCLYVGTKWVRTFRRRTILDLPR